MGDGQPGRRVDPLIVDRPDLELVGAKVYSAEKDVDAGVIAGIDPVGVVATQDIDALFLTSGPIASPTCRVTRRSTTCAGSSPAAPTSSRRRSCLHPRSLPPDDLARLLDVASRARAHNSSTAPASTPATSAGCCRSRSSGMSRSIDRIVLQERADWTFYESTHITFDNMRFGRPADEVSEEASDFLRFNSGIFKEEIALLG